MRPIKLKYIKIHKVKKRKGTVCINKSDLLSFGTSGLICCEEGRFTARQIEAGRKFIRKRILKQGQLWIIKFPHRSLTDKKVGARIGKGKGGVSFWYCNVYPGIVLYEISGISKNLSKNIFKDVNNLFSFRTRVFYRDNIL